MIINKRYIKYYIIVFFVLVIGFIFINKKQNYEIHIIDVVNGDCTFIKTKSENIVFGGGNKEDNDIIFNYLYDRDVFKIDKIFIPYPKEEYICGLKRIIDIINVEEIYFASIENIDDEGRAFIKNVESKGIKMLKLEDDSFSIDDITIKVLSPTKKGVMQEKDKVPVIKVENKYRSLLWIPYCNELIKTDLLLNKDSLNADILKLAQDNAFFLEEDFLGLVDPKIVLFTRNKKVSEKEVDNIYTYNPNISIFSLKKEGYIYFYNNDIVTERLLKIKIQ